MHELCQFEWDVLEGKVSGWGAALGHAIEVLRARGLMEAVTTDPTAAGYRAIIKRQRKQIEELKFGCFDKLIKHFDAQVTDHRNRANAAFQRGKLRDAVELEWSADVFVSVTYQLKDMRDG